MSSQLDTRYHRPDPTVRELHWLLALEYAKIAGKLPEIGRAELEHRAWARQVLFQMAEGET